VTTSPIGISSFALAYPLTTRVADEFAGLAELGYTLVEICPDDLSALDAEEIRGAAESAGLALSVGGVFTAAHDISADDLAGREAGLDYLLGCIDFAAALRAPVVSGPMYSAAGKARVLSVEERARQRRHVEDNLRRAADHAAGAQVTLAIEPLNRFETDLVNTVEQGLALVDTIDRPNVGLTIDTFHAHIEEKSLGRAIALAGKRLISFQASESDRGIPGSGQVRWDEAFDALDAIGYGGPIVVESFDWTHPDIASGLALWRPVATSMNDVVRESITFLRARRPRVELGGGGAVRSCGR